MRRRHIATPRLEAMEDRVVLSAVSLKVSPPTSAQFRTFGNHVKNAANSIRKELFHLVQHRSGHPSQALWQSRPAPSRPASQTLFGIPWLKI